MSQVWSRVLAIPALVGEQALQVAKGGKFVGIIAASESLNIQARSAGDQTADLQGAVAGNIFEIPDTFERLDIQTGSGAAGSVTLVISDVPFSVASFSINAAIVSGTKFKTTADKACANGVQTLVIAANSGRKTVVVTPVSAIATPLRFGDINTAAGQGEPLGQYQPGVFDCTDGLYAWNPNAGPVNVAILEILT